MATAPPPTTHPSATKQPATQAPATQAPATHPKGSAARVLLTSVFGPYAQDDAYGSRTINPMELYHNQVTRAQGPFSLRMFHRSWSLMFLQDENSSLSAYNCITYE